MKTASFREKNLHLTGPMCEEDIVGVESKQELYTNKINGMFGLNWELGKKLLSYVAAQKLETRQTGKNYSEAGLLRLNLYSPMISLRDMV